MLFVIAGLGNPGRKYDCTRHNAGFRVVDRLAERHSIAVDRGRFSAKAGDGEIDGRRVLLLKPTTYMNLSGNSVAAAVRFFKVSRQNLLVVHDDVDLALGRIQLKRGGGHGGHKGLMSIAESLGETDFARARIGIGRPPENLEVADYVLQPFEAGEQQLFDESVERAALAIECWLRDGLVKAMNDYNAFGQSEEEK